MTSPSLSLQQKKQTNLADLIPAITSLGVVAFLILGLPYAQGTGDADLTLWDFLEYFWQTEQWQHCWLVLPAIGFIVYHQRKALAAAPLKGTSVGVIVLLAAFSIYWIGYRVDNYFFGFLSIQLAVAGLVIWFAGWRWLIILAFPLVFMTFLWPLHFLESNITFPLRAIMSKASVVVLNFIGIPVILQGTGILSAPDALTGMRPGQRFSVDVADPCSGIRSLFALMMVSALYGFFTLKEWWQKWIIFLCSIPLAVLGNLCRILMLTFGTMAMGPAVAIGTLENPSFFHMAAGYVVFAVALGGMIGIGWVLQVLPKLIGRARTSEVKELLSGRSGETTDSGSRPEKRKQKEIDPY